MVVAAEKTEGWPVAESTEIEPIMHIYFFILMHTQMPIQT